MPINIRKKNNTNPTFDTHNKAARFYTKRSICNVFGRIKKEYHKKTLVSFSISGSNNHTLDDINIILCSLIENGGNFYKFAYSLGEVQHCVTYVCIFDTNEQANMWILSLSSETLSIFNISALTKLEKTINWAEWRD